MKHIKRVSVEKAAIFPTDLEGLLALLTDPIGYLIALLKEIFGLNNGPQAS